MSAELETADGEQLSFETSAALWGRVAGDVAAGVFVETVSWDYDEPIENYGYWWLEIDSDTAAGEMRALFEPDATSTLTLTLTDC